MRGLDLAPRLAELAGALRQRGVAVVTGDEIDAAHAYARVDAADREEVRLALRIALKIPRDAWATFDKLYSTFWSGADHGSVAWNEAQARRRERESSRGGRFPRWNPGAARIEDPAGRDPRDDATPGYSPRALGRHPTLTADAIEIAEMDRVLDRLARRLATRPSRRLVPHPRRGGADLRRSFRRAVATDGEFVNLARRVRRIEQPELTFVCDTSGSMQAHTRFLLSFVLSLKRVARRTEAYAFNTRLTRLTPWLMARDRARVLERISAGVEDWGGGTRIGDSLYELLDRHGARLRPAKTVLVILSDGLDRGDPGRLARALGALRRRVRKVIWLNPLMGDARYQPLARGMQAALPFVDHFSSVHDTQSLERLIPQLVS